MKVVVLYFGLIEEAIQKSSEQIVLTNNTTLTNLLEILCKKYPLLHELEYQIAVNKKIATIKTSINNGAEIALLPPFAGG